ncbi:MAG: hypothetical protein B7Y80_13910 [Hyphomicrobium sp. 32-62-53]|nr:MAG: hypothetical protein B7Z29_07460 [Hyphomicrobium sp. 12-62-95]OYX98803.1 MAG: hypothetical protein B7Y80_13910 [Hyphomicrobium sp. 32-62-53]
MLHVNGITETEEHGPLAGDVQKLVRIVDRWAAERPLLDEVSLFGQRLRPNHNGSHPVELAVRFDDARLNDGFDDWIEELRTNFAALSRALGEPVSVVTPDMRKAWWTIVHGTELSALATGKVRIITAQAEPAAACVRATIASRRAAPTWRWPAIWQFLASATTPRRPAI